MQTAGELLLLLPMGLQTRSRGRRRRPEVSFDPTPHREQLVAILRELEARLSPGDGAALPTRELHAILRRHPREGRGFFSRAELISGIRAFGREAGIGLGEQALVRSLRMRPVRTQSGVTPVTVFTKPYPCPGECVFCPNDVRMPKSYLAREPGCQRAESNGFDPYLQTYNRLKALTAIGHPIAKVEIIILGGTFSFYPGAYQRWFIKRCFDALNDLGAGREASADVGAARVDHHTLPARVDGRSPDLSYNRELSRFLKVLHGERMLHGAEHASWDELERAQRDNERAGCRNVGLVVETRPDRLDRAEALRLRRLGCTKVQIGFQSLDDDILARNKRGHDVAATVDAMRVLRAVGFKVHAHWMPNLLDATPQRDREDYVRMFADPAFRPDELKVYPCSLIESAELMVHYEAGDYRPYTHEELLEVLLFVLEHTPRYCRLSRVVRDISSEDIVTGNRQSNFREVAERALRERGGRGADIRAREIKHEGVEIGTLQLRDTSYRTSVGQERFLELVTGDDRVAAFLRLSLPDDGVFVPEVADSAMIRELHVYGAALDLGDRDPARAQHRGLGSRLIAAARRIARGGGYRDLAVISAVGTREYYRNQGFGDGVLYQHVAP
ncbi:MAG: tRNA uridine(34) 5-carboxymethylaminomethyl modification radical SAM/GNAT enzyme Elp3 [Myxococcales bacterium]|nr:tRNA uridine(34) 5-carboxymethylaminomethyl modification radical SAM/GNAT enzyme Elp3 [Myxococcales bacterium]